MNRKNIYLLISSITLPVFILLLIEAGLRCAHYGTNLDDLFLTTPDGQYLYMNKDISKRYFTISQATTGNVEFFKKIKDTNTFRMFVLGESAALGFPYPNNISFQRMLKYELQKDNPQKNIEIINLSLTAINSYTFYDFGKELHKYAPDAILIYGGHNEYYGALGVGSTSTLGSNPMIVRVIIGLRQTKLVQLLEDLANKLKSTTSQKESDNLMKYVVKEQLIPYKSPLFNKGIQQFEQNMRGLLILLEKERIPVFWSTVATNIKDQYPFRSLFSPKTDSTSYNKQLAIAKQYLQQCNLMVADTLVNKLLQLDSTNADCFYQMGKIKLAFGENKQAFQYFNEAKQKDGLRFRAPDEINEVIKHLSSQFKNIYLVDAEQGFQKRSMNGIPGKELLLEHVHPTIDGHRVIARCFLHSILQSGLLEKNQLETHFDLQKSFLSFPILLFDSLVGEYACARLREGFPFYEQVKKIQPKTTIEKAAMQYVMKKNWYQSMEQLYKHAILVKDYSLALDILRVRILDNEYDVSFWNSAGEVCMVLKDYEQALMYYEKSFALYNTFSCVQEIISNALRLDKPEVAICYMEYAIANNQTAMNFSLLKDFCQQIIHCKQHLKINPTIDTYRKIADIYSMIGNLEVADLYKEKEREIKQ